MTSLAIDHGAAGTRIAWYDASAAAPMIALINERGLSIQDALDSIHRQLPEVNIERAQLLASHFDRDRTTTSHRAEPSSPSPLQLGNRTVHLHQEKISRSVAAAIYTAWAHRDHTADRPRSTRTMLVVDIGARQLEISLVRVDLHPSTVELLDYTRGPESGDIADRSIAVEVCRRVSRGATANLPDTLAELSTAVRSHPAGFLATWIAQCQTLKEEFCLHARFLRDGDWSRLHAPRAKFATSNGRSIEIELDNATFEASLAPLFQKIRMRIVELLERQSVDDLPDAVVCTGASCALFGFREKVVESALRTVMSGTALDTVLGSISLPADRFDRPAALGGSLIAAGIVRPKEQLAHDLAIMGDLSSGMARALGLPSGAVFLSPIIPRGVELPATVTSQELGLPTSIAPGGHLDLTIAIGPDRNRPVVHTWNVRHPGGRKPQSVRWRITAKLDGTLELRVEPHEGRAFDVSTHYVQGLRDVQPSSKRASPIKTTKLAPHQLRDAIARHSTSAQAFGHQEDSL